MVGIITSIPKISKTDIRQYKSNRIDFESFLSGIRNAKKIIII